MPKGGGGLSCNLCWSELQAPFIVTSCGHAFCEKHKTDASLQASTCPGCGSHLPSHGGMRLANYDVKSTTDWTVLNGLRPELVLKIADRAVGFWVAQERNKTAAATHALNEADKRKEEYKQRCNTLYQQQEDELAHERRAKEQATAQSQEFEHELNALQDKYQDSERRARLLEETVVELKRRRMGAGQSPARPGGGHAHQLHHSADAYESDGSPRRRRRLGVAPRARPPAGLRSPFGGGALGSPARPPSKSPLASPTASASAAGLDAPPVGGAARPAPPPARRATAAALAAAAATARARPPWPRRRRRWRAQPRQHAAAPLERGLLGGGGGALRRRHPVRGAAHGPLVRLRDDGRRPRLSVWQVKRTRTLTIVTFVSTVGLLK